MPLLVPNLDDRTFDQLATEARGLIPKHFPAWTDHNASDPGITLLELFAFVLEAGIYQINRVPERSLEHFAALVGVTREPGEPMATTLRRALEAIQAKERAITEAEFEALAKQAAPGIARANAIVEIADTPNVFPDEQLIKVIIVPDEPDDPEPTPTDELRQQVFDFLRARCLITTRVRVPAPEYTPVTVNVTIARDRSSQVSAEAVQQSVADAIRRFLSPLLGGPEGAGWEFGRPVFRSELFQLLEGMPGVDHVHQLLLNGDETVGQVALSSSTSLVKLDQGNLVVKVVEL
jgi:hypothetical protein